MGMKRVAASVAAAVAVSGAPAMTASASAAPGVCSGVKSCKVVSRVDVDGDGRKDQVGLVQRSSYPQNATITVRVRTAKGRTMKASHRATWYGSAWHGAAKMDGRAGRELVVGSSAGAHARFFRVLTYRNGKLVTLKAPGGARTWWVDSSYSMNGGWFRSTSKGKVYMTSKSATRNWSARGHDLRIYKYQWKNGSWKRVSSSRNPRATDKSAYATAGWHVRGLKKYSG